MVKTGDILICIEVPNSFYDLEIGHRLEVKKVAKNEYGEDGVVTLSPLTLIENKRKEIDKLNPINYYKAFRLKFFTSGEYEKYFTSNRKYKINKFLEE